MQVLPDNRLLTLPLKGSLSQRLISPFVAFSLQFLSRWPLIRPPSRRRKRMVSFYARFTASSNFRDWFRHMHAVSHQDIGWEYELGIFEEICFEYLCVRLVLRQWCISRWNPLSPMLFFQEAQHQRAFFSADSSASATSMQLPFAPGLAVHDHFFWH